MVKRSIVMGMVLALAACGDDEGTRGFVAADSDDAQVPESIGGETTLDPDTVPEPDTSSAPDTNGPEASDTAEPDTSAGPDTRDTAEPDTRDVGTETRPSECVVDGDCAERAASACTRWRCASDMCQEVALADGVVCEEDGERGRCGGSVCRFTCGDTLVQESQGESCDDGNADPDDGCDACTLVEAIGAGWTGGQCDSDVECGPTGSQCIFGVGGGSCAIACDAFCDDTPGAPVTFCIDAADYQSRMDTTLPAALSDALCVAKCDFALFPRTGCRDGLHCELHTRHSQLVEDEVCVPGAWSVGLRLSASGADVLGADPAGPAPAEPYATLLEATCGGVFTAVDARLFRGLADTLLAMGPDGRARTWERLCSPPAGLPTWHGLHAEAGRAFRLTGARLAVVDWSAYALYGGPGARDFRVGGPLYTSRVMVYRSGTTQWLYADGAEDHPHPDPEAGRHFAAIDGKEWAPLESAIEPNIEYVLIKASGGGRFYRQWAPVETVAYLGEMALDHLFTHGVPLGIGDISLPTGGDIDDHGSHETGLDVDLYLLTFRPDARGALDVTQPRLWVADCDQSGGVWDCWYYDNANNALENLSAPLHVPLAEQLESLADFALTHDGPSHFVQHDVVTLAPYRALGGTRPRFIDATNDAALGWPVHQNHVHVRFFAW